MHNICWEDKHTFIIICEHTCRYMPQNNLYIDIVKFHLTKYFYIAYKKEQPNWNTVCSILHIPSI